MADNAENISWGIIGACASLAVGMGLAVAVIRGAPYVAFGVVSDLITKPNETQNSLAVSCKADVPAPRSQPSYGPTDFFEVMDFKGCDVTRVKLTCDFPLNVGTTTLVKSPGGYTVSRPSEYCDLEYKTQSSYRPYHLGVRFNLRPATGWMLDNS